MDADQLPVGLQENQLQQPATAGNGAARSDAEIRTADLIVQASLPALLLGQARAGDLRHAIDRRDRARIDGSFEWNPESVTDRDSPLLHGDGGERRSKNVACGVDALHGGAEVPVHDDPSAGIEIDPGGLQTEAFGIRDPSRGEQNGVRKEAALPSIASPPVRHPSRQRFPQSRRTYTVTPHFLNSSSMQAGDLAIHHGDQAGSDDRASVTFAPSAWQMVANSTPTGPPPTMRMSFGTPAAMQDRVGVADARDVERDVLRPEGPRTGRDQDRLRAELALSSHPRRTRSRSRPRRGGRVALDVVTRCTLRYSRQSTFCSSPQTLPGALADDVGRDLRRRRDPQAVDVSFTEPGEVERRLSKCLGRQLRQSWLRFHLAAPSQ